MNSENVEIISEKTLYQGFLCLKRLELRYRLFAGDWSPVIHRELLLRHEVVAVLPYDPDQDKVVLIEQFRPGALKGEEEPWLLELVAGIMDTDEDIETVAHRESYEEAGIRLQALLPIFKYWASPGGSTERVHMFCAKVDATTAQGIHGLAAEHEDIRVHVLSTQEAWEGIANGRINNAATLIALQWLQLHKAQIKTTFMTK